MKLTINKYLNARISEASTKATYNFYRSPGDTIEIDNVLVGEEIDGNSIWYHCKDDGCYYWSGGIVEEEFEISNNSITNENAIEILTSLQNDRSFYLSKKIVGYKGLGIGYKNGNPQFTLCLIVFVEKKIAEPQLQNSFIVPRYIFYKGVKITTDVKEVLRPATHGYKDYLNNEKLIPDNNFTPMAIGASISGTNPKVDGYGTRTIKVNKGIDVFLMSCFHVLFYDKILSEGDCFFNNINSSRKATFPSPIINSTGKTNFEDSVVEGEISGYYDYSLVKLQNTFEIVNKFENDTIVSFVERKDIKALINVTVTSIGATSYKQSGIITEIRSEILIDCKGFQRKYLDVIVAEKMSMPGDSGAPVVTFDNKLLGYIIGGNKDNVTYILPFYRLFLNKGITI